MVRLLVFAFIGASVLAAVPHYASQFQASRTERLQADGEPTQAAATPTAAPAATYAKGRTVTLEQDGRGHFNGEFRINGRPVEGMIDTGATYVALNVSTARRLGINPAKQDFKYDVSTANGTTQAAHVVLSRMELGGIRVSDVEAFVLSDANLSTTLIGMSFMKKLASYRVEDGRLNLVD